MPPLSDQVVEAVRLLDEAFGPTPPTVGTAEARNVNVLAAFLDQQRGVRAAEALEALDAAGFINDPKALATADPRELADLIRNGQRPIPGGVVAGLIRLASWMAGHGGIDGMADVATATLREELLGLRRIGPTLADRILGDGLGRSAFAVGRLDYRIMLRHGWIDATADYVEAREAVEYAAGDDPELLAALGAGFGRLGTFCRAAAPRCDRCPLRPLLPEGGPIAWE